MLDFTLSAVWVVFYVVFMLQLQSKNCWISQSPQTQHSFRVVLQTGKRLWRNSKRMEYQLHIECLCTMLQSREKVFQWILRWIQALEHNNNMF